MQRIAAYAALVMAAGLLGLQVVAAVEYTEGGTLYTRASVIAALVTVAALPVFIEAARHVSRLIAVCLFVAFVAMLAYSLPAQIGRAGEVKDAKARGSEIADTARQDLEETRQRLKWATDDWQQECRSGAGKQCRSKGQTVQALEVRAKTLAADVAAAPVGDIASDTLSWATGGLVTAETIRRGSILAFVLGLDVSIWALIWFATKVFAPVSTVSARVERPATVSEPAGDYDTQVAAVIRALRDRDGAICGDIGRAMLTEKSEASKRIADAERLGLVVKRADGKCKRVYLTDLGRSVAAH